MANPSPWGAFAEGVAGGISGGMQNYAVGAMRAFDVKQKKSEKRLATAFELAGMYKGDAQNDIVKNQILPAMEELGYYTNEEIKGFGDSFDANTPTGKTLLDGAIKTFKSYTKGNISGTDALEGLNVLISGYQGELTKEQEGSLKSMREGIKSGEEQKSFTTGMGLVETGQPLSQEALSAFSKTAEGREYATARRTRRETSKTPTPSGYEEMSVGEGKVQKMKYNPQTKKHDIPYGKPYVKKAPSGWQRKTRSFTKNGKAYKQDYDYNPKTRESVDAGGAYEYKDIGSALMDFFNKDSSNDPDKVW